MAAVQMTYAAGIAKALAGLVANMETQNSITRLCEDDAIGFGKAVFQGTADNQVTATAGTLFRGVSIIDVTLSHDTPDQYEEGDNMAILERGVIWVEAGDDVAAGAAAFLDGDGNFVESTSGATALTGVTFDSSGADGDLVKIRIR